MSHLVFTFLLSFPLLAAPPLARPSVPVEVPVVGRPDHFSEAVGQSFKVTMRASRAEMYVGQSLTLTVRVSALGPWRAAPERPRLLDLPKFTDRFKIDRSASEKPDRQLERAWEFDYNLRPLRENVERIPPLPFVWYRPNRIGNLPGFFMTTYADEIDLKIKPVPPPTQTIPAKPIEVPERYFRIIEGSAVLTREQLFQMPVWPMLSVYLLGPIVVASLWCIAWRRLNPDAGHRKVKRQSQAAQEALAAIKTVGALDGPAQAARLTAIAGMYLRHRMDLPTTEPTPAEVADHLRACGGATETADKAADFFRICDAARFAPAFLAGPVDLADAAVRFIHLLEGEKWSRR